MRVITITVYKGAAHDVMITRVKCHMGICRVTHTSTMRLDYALSSLKEGERIIASHSLMTGPLISAETNLLLRSIAYNLSIVWSPVLHGKNLNK